MTIPTPIPKMIARKNPIESEMAECTLANRFEWQIGNQLRCFQQSICRRLPSMPKSKVHIGPNKSRCTGGQCDGVYLTTEKHRPVD